MPNNRIVNLTVSGPVVFIGDVTSPQPDFPRVVLNASTHIHQRSFWYRKSCLPGYFTSIAAGTSDACFFTLVNKNELVSNDVFKVFSLQS